jgi:predicted nuclease of predicted toxin-antitoxin system
VKLLFDENLSPRLIELLRSSYPDSQHVDPLGLRGQPDRAIWDHARQHGLTIVSKDNDFRQLSFLYGPPPKVIWLVVANAGTATVAGLLLDRIEVVREYLVDPEAGLLVLELNPLRV